MEIDYFLDMTTVDRRSGTLNIPHNLRRRHILSLFDPSKTGTRFSAWIVVLLGLLLVACGGQSGLPTESNGIYPLDRLFQKYFDQLGGKSVLGVVISPMYGQGEISYQYTSTCLMTFDHSSQEYSLAPLGLDMGIGEMPLPENTPGRGEYLAGHYVYPPFQAIFDQLGGIKTVGAPITEVRYNETERRFEQYFTNLGFFQLEGDSSGQVYLLAYGAWKCGSHCTYPSPLNSRIDIPLKKAAPFVKLVSTLGTDFTGFALTEPFIASDGTLEQTYENVLMAVNPEHPDQVSLRPLPELSGIKPDPLELPSHDPKEYFFPLEGERGFNIPVTFMEYIKTHGGVKYTGEPITHVRQNSDNLLEQCFKFICLQQKRDPYGELTVAPVSLGLAYRQKNNPVNPNTPPEANLHQVAIQLWERYPMISSDREQVIGAGLFSGDTPIPNVAPELDVFLPDGTQWLLSMPATGDNGETRQKLDSIQAENGTLIPYQVCIAPPGQPKFCVKDSFIVWNVSDLKYVNVQFLPAIYNWIQEQISTVFLPLVQR
jgi:hypothetical protein